MFGFWYTMLNALAFAFKVGYASEFRVLCYVQHSLLSSLLIGCVFLLLSLFLHSLPFASPMSLLHVYACVVVAHVQLHFFRLSFRKNRYPKRFNVYHFIIKLLCVNGVINKQPKRLLKCLKCQKGFDRSVCTNISKFVYIF